MADVEVALLDLFADLADVVTSTPADLEDRLPVLRARRIGGGGGRDADFPIVSLQHFTAASAADPRAHFDLADATEARLLEIADYGPRLVSGVCLESPVKDSGPVELTYPNPSVRVAESIYRLTIRR